VQRDPSRCWVPPVKFFGSPNWRSPWHPQLSSFWASLGTRLTYALLTGVSSQQPFAGSNPQLHGVCLGHLRSRAVRGDICSVFEAGVTTLRGIDYIRNGYIMPHMAKPEPAAPLTPAVFHILLALFGKERHGYDIMQQVKTDSRNAVKMGPGTLYGSLDRMIAAGLVAQGNSRDPRRIYYRLTALGQGTLRAEAERLSALASTARRQLGPT